MYKIEIKKKKLSLFLKRPHCLSLGQALQYWGTLCTHLIKPTHLSEDGSRSWEQEQAITELTRARTWVCRVTWARSVQSETAKYKTRQNQNT